MSAPGIECRGHLIGLARLKSEPPPGRGARRLRRSGSRYAGVIDVDPKTLRKHYRRELDHGHVKANARVAENLYRKATGEGRDAVVAAIFWLKTRAGWKETNVQELKGPPPRIEISWADSKLL